MTGAVTSPQAISTATNRSKLSKIWSSPEWAAFVKKHTAGKVCENCKKVEGDIAINNDGEEYVVHLTVDHPFRWAYKSEALYLDFEASMCRVVCRTCNSLFEKGLDMCPRCLKNYKQMREPICRDCLFELYPAAKAAFEQGQKDQKDRQRNRSKKHQLKKDPHPCDRHSRQSVNCLWPGYGACDQNRKNASKNKCGHYKVRRAEA